MLLIILLMLVYHFCGGKATQNQKVQDFPFVQFPLIFGFLYCIEGYSFLHTQIRICKLQAKMSLSKMILEGKPRYKTGGFIYG